MLQEGRPIAYLSKALAPKNLGLLIYEKEILAVVMAVQKWRPYKVGKHFKIITDQRVSTSMQHKWLTKLAGYDYEIVYHSGKENIAEDALSRVREEREEPIIMALSFLIANWLGVLQDEWKNDENIQKLIHEIQQDQNLHSKFTWVDNQLRYKGRLWLGDRFEIKKMILQEANGGVEGGHSRVKKTLERVRRAFYWKKMRREVCKFVAECDTC